MRSVKKVGSLVAMEFEVYNASNHQPVDSLVTGDFTRLLSVGGVDSAIAVTIAFLTSGRYRATFTPNAADVWRLVVRHATHQPRGWAETYDVTADGVLTVDGVLDKADTIETGVSLRQAVRAIAAESAGDVTGGPGVAAFKGVGGSTTRLTSTADANGNRTVVKNLS